MTKYTTEVTEQLNATLAVNSKVQKDVKDLEAKIKALTEEMAIKDEEFKKQQAVIEVHRVFSFQQQKES